MIWAGISALLAALVLWLLRPLLTPSRADAPGIGGTERRLQVFRDQLQELERDRSAGLIAPSEFAAAKLEVERRLLEAAAIEDDVAPVRPRGRWRLAIPLAVIVSAGPILVYLQLGAPTLPDAPLAARSSEAQDRVEMLALLGKLKEHLKAKPDDIDGWALYARSLRDLGKVDESIQAYERALKDSDGRPDIGAALAELLIEQANGTVTPRALGLYEEVLAKKPDDPRARYYIALSTAQMGDTEKALEQFVSLGETSPKGAPWLATVQARIDELSQRLGRPSPQILERDTAKPSPGPDQAQIADAAKLNDAERRTMIESMVKRLDDRLQQNPDDPDGWLKLGRSYGVLGDVERGRTALAEAARRAPARIDIQLEYAHALYAPGETKPPPPEFTAVMRRILALDPNQPEALWFVGRDEARAGKRDSAIELLTRLLTRLPSDAPIRAKVEEAISQVRKS